MSAVRYLFDEDFNGRQDYPIGPAIEELGLITEASTAEEWHGVIAFFPL